MFSGVASNTASVDTGKILTEMKERILKMASCETLKIINMPESEKNAHPTMKMKIK